VVLRGLRPCFPVGTPPGYAQLAASCWHATAGARPNFGEVISRLQVGTRASNLAGCMPVDVGGWPAEMVG
jgi:hypothetical protein